MTKILSVTNTNDTNLNSQEDLDNREREAIVNSLVEQKLPRVFNPSVYINRIAESYGISVKDARICLKEAIEQLETQNCSTKQNSEQNDEEKLYAQSGYFYPQSNSTTQKKERDGMDSLVAYASFQRLKFGL